MHSNMNDLGRCAREIFCCLFLGSCGVSCAGASSVAVGDLPDIATLQTTLSDTFFLDADGMAKVSRTTPYVGASSACAHTGAHVHFSNTGAPYTVNLYAPADGVITGVTTCYDIGESDRYGIDMAIANDNGTSVIFEFSIEPQDGHPCTSGEANAFAQYIQVTEGQTVSKGDVLGQMLKTDDGDDGAHVHYNLAKGDAFFCPNIFATSIVTQLSAIFGADSCGDTFTDSLCFQTTADERLITE